ncbi:MAG: TIGR03619 family F420-dependent LLM class oxidoreductase [Candidatus Poribacteria bacterium]|nr:TIGR03619 family F420-dependent LLM class oxidoreductase [Candidatus Poribacteria bacterium]
MKIGLAFPNHGPDASEATRVLPAKLEALGYNSIWFTDHVIGHDSFVDSKSDNSYGPQWFEPLTCLSYAAATTTRIKLGMGIMVVPYRHPVMAAKILSTLDQLSDGRVIAGIGTGWCQPEFEALGTGHLFEKRGPVTDEALAIMQKCWQGGTVSWDGEYFSFPEIEFSPTPVQESLPIWAGSLGTARAPLRRVARFADVWHPAAISPEEMRDGGEMLDEMAGRKITRTIRVGDNLEPQVDHLPALVNAYAEAGCEEVVLDFTVFRKSLEAPDAVHRFEEKASQLKELLGY